MEQLRCAGIVAGVTISRSAFPNKLGNSVVYARYNGMWDRDKYPSAGGGTLMEKARANCEAVLTCALKEKETTGKDGKVVKAFMVGKTRTYFRAGALELLESQRVTGLDCHAVAIQKYVRGFLVRQSLGIVPSKKKDEEEAKKRAEEERLAALAAEREALDAQARNEVSNATKEAKSLEKDLQAEDEKVARDVHDIETKASMVDAEKVDLANRLKELSEGVSAQKTEEARVTAKLEANTALMKTLKKENQKLHKSLDKVTANYESLSKNNKKLTDALGVDNDAQKDYEYATTVNERLLEDRDATVADHLKLKEDVAEGQMKYMAVAESRLEIQRTLAKILTLIQDQCSDNQLMQDTQNIALTCEAEAKGVMDQLNATYG